MSSQNEPDNLFKEETFIDIERLNWQEILDQHNQKFGKVQWLKNQDEQFLQFKNNKNVKIIDIKDWSINRFVDEVNQCETILSSSLHGIICGDSYGIPSYWIELSDKVHGAGFKFRDYFSSVNRPILDPIRPNLNQRIIAISNHFYKYKIDIDLDKLFNACPFKK